MNTHIVNSQTPYTCHCEDYVINVALFPFIQSCEDVSAQIDNLELWLLAKKLHSSSQAGGADRFAGLKVRNFRGCSGNQRIPWILSAQKAVYFQPVRLLHWHVLERVDCNINAVLKQRLLDFSAKHSHAANVTQRAIQNPVSGSPDRNYACF